MVDLWFFISSYSVIQSCGGSLVFISSYSEIPACEGSLFIMVPLDQLQLDSWLGRISGFFISSNSEIQSCGGSLFFISSYSEV